MAFGMAIFQYSNSSRNERIWNPDGALRLPLVQRKAMAIGLAILKYPKTRTRVLGNSPTSFRISFLLNL
jgi:hypothetical protein